MTTKYDYLKYIQEICDANIEKPFLRLKKQIDENNCDYLGLDHGFYCCYLEMVLYNETKCEHRLNIIKEYFKNSLELYRRIRDNGLVYPRHLINHMFGVGNFCKIYRFLRDNKCLSCGDVETTYDFLCYVCKWTVDYPEWGTHNRATSRGIAMMEANLCFPERTMGKVWYNVGKSLLIDNMSKWSIEDASTYNPIWIKDIMELDKYFNIILPNHDVVIQYYLNEYCYVQNPLFITTEFGDARMGTQWGVVLDILEQGATRYQNGVYKYFAHRIFEKMSKIDDILGFAANQARFIASAFENCNDEIKEVTPYMQSLEVMDDFIGKKIVFKNGLDEEKSTFMLLNYRDVPENGVLGRRNLDQTICAPAEKNHHGHCDENAIDLLTYRGSILLHDGGYREKIDLSGAYRSDFYHNKLLIRNNIQKDRLSLLMSEPFYNPVKSEKLYFYDLKHYDVSRTRLYDEKHSVINDRAIVYLKEENIYLVVDIVKSLRNQNYTFSNQYYTQNIEEVDSNIFITSFNHIGTDEVKPYIVNDQKQKLIIAFPTKSKEKTIYINKDIRRSYTTETLLSEISEIKLAKNKYFCTATVLYPIDNQTNYSFIKKISCKCVNNGFVVKVNIKNRKYEFGFKLDEMSGLIKSRRPMYSFDTTKVKYLNITSDALFSGVIETKNSIYYSFVAGSKLIHSNKTLFAIETASEFFQADVTVANNFGSYNLYEDEIEK